MNRQSITSISDSELERLHAKIKEPPTYDEAISQANEWKIRFNHLRANYDALRAVYDALKADYGQAEEKHDLEMQRVKRTIQEKLQEKRAKITAEQITAKFRASMRKKIVKELVDEGANPEAITIKHQNLITHSNQRIANLKARIKELEAGIDGCKLDE